MDGHGATLAASPGPLRRKFLGWHNWLAYGPLVLGWWGTTVAPGQGAVVWLVGAGFGALCFVLGRWLSAGGRSG